MPRSTKKKKLIPNSEVLPRQNLAVPAQETRNIPQNGNDKPSEKQGQATVNTPVKSVETAPVQEAKGAFCGVQKGAEVPVKPTENGKKEFSEEPAERQPGKLHQNSSLPEEPMEFLDDIPWDEQAPSMSSQDAEMMMNDWNEFADAGGGDEDDEDESSINSSGSKKTLEVSSDRPKTSAPDVRVEKSELSDMQRWRNVVENLREPLSTIMAGARVDCFSRNSVEVTLPVVYRTLITENHVRDVDRVLAREVYQGCRFAVRFDEIGDETQTLAARKAKEQFEAEQKAFERVREHAVMKTIIEVFHVNPDEIRFTINPDRTTNEQSH